MESDNKKWTFETELRVETASQYEKVSGEWVRFFFRVCALLVIVEARYILNHLLRDVWCAESKNQIE